MPELPEVQTVVGQLAPRITGRLLRRVEVYDPKLALDCAAQVRGRRIDSVFRLGKQVLFELRDPAGRRAPLWLGFHLRMTGALVYNGAKRRPAQRHVRARLVLDRGDVVFTDLRRFGTARLVDCLERMQPVGLEPLCPGFTRAALAGLLEGSRQALKPWLLRQDRLVGVGNIYASEILFRARLGPWRRAGSLSAKEIDRLHRATCRVLQEAVACCGTTVSDYRDAEGEAGGFQEFLCVYGREGERCRRCRGTVERITQQGRSTFFCPACQGAESHVAKTTVTGKSKTRRSR